MRFATLLTVPALLTSLTAQQFTAEQRAELRQIIREEIRAAVKDLHRAPPETADTGDRAAGVRLLPARSGAFDGLGQGSAVQGNDGQVTFGWTAVAPAGEIEKSARKPAPKHSEVIVLDNGGKAIEIKLDDITTDMKPITHIREIEGSKLLQLLERVSEGPATTQRSHEVIEVGPEMQLLLRSLGREQHEKADSKKADSKKAKKAKKAKKKKSKKSKTSKQAESVGTFVFSTDAEAPRLVDLGAGLITCHGTTTSANPDQGKTACCEPCEAPACCEAPKAAPAPKVTNTKQLLR